MRRLIVTSLAERELRGAFAWTLQHYPAHAQRFETEIESTLSILHDAPLRWSQWRRSGYRRCLLPRLPYSFFYTVDDQAVHVVAFLHQHQDLTRRFREDP